MKGDPILVIPDTRRVVAQAWGSCREVPQIDAIRVTLDPCRIIAEPLEGCRGDHQFTTKNDKAETHSVAESARNRTLGKADKPEKISTDSDRYTAPSEKSGTSPWASIPRTASSGKTKNSSPNGMPVPSEITEDHRAAKKDPTHMNPNPEKTAYRRQTPVTPQTRATQPALLGEATGLPGGIASNTWRFRRKSHDIFREIEDGQGQEPHCPDGMGKTKHGQQITPYRYYDSSKRT